jgi:hypothetical protein
MLLAGDGPDRQTALWLQDIGQDLLDKLAGAQLIVGRKSEAMAKQIDAYIETREEAAVNTIKNLKTG